MKSIITAIVIAITTLGIYTHAKADAEITSTTPIYEMLDNILQTIVIMSVEKGIDNVTTTDAKTIGQRIAKQRAEQIKSRPTSSNIIRKALESEAREIQNMAKKYENTQERVNVEANDASKEVTRLEGEVNLYKGVDIVKAGQLAAQYDHAVEEAETRTTYATQHYLIAHALNVAALEIATQAAKQ